MTNGFHSNQKKGDKMKLTSNAFLALSVAAALPCFADVLDEGEWPAVKPEFVEVPPRTVDTFSFDAPLHSSWLFYFADDAEELLKSL